MNEKVVITAAITGGVGDKTKHPNLPVTPREIAESAIEACAAGAAVAHIHVRDPKTSEPAMDLELYREVVDRIRGGCDMLINLTTGAGARIIPDESESIGLAAGTNWSSPEKRTEHIVDLRPELCSLDVGSMNFGPRIFGNPVPHVEDMAARIQKAGVRPELEVFDLGHIRIGKSLMEKGLVSSPPLFQICLGIPWGIPASTKDMLIMKEALPPDAVWGGFAIGPESFPMAAQSVLLGGNVRVGFEDNFFLARGKPARSNAELVEKAARLLRAMDREPATPEEAREILKIQ